MTFILKLFFKKLYYYFLKIFQKLYNPTKNKIYRAGCIKKVFIAVVKNQSQILYI